MSATDTPSASVRIALHRLQSTVELVEMAIVAGSWDVAESAAIQAGSLVTDLTQALRRLADQLAPRQAANNG